MKKTVSRNAKNTSSSKRSAPSIILLGGIGAGLVGFLRSGKAKTR